MTVAAVTHRVEGDGRQYRELEAGVRPFHALAESTGDVSGGHIPLQFLFNPDQVTGQSPPYVTLTRVTVGCRTAAATGGVLVYQPQDQWERSSKGDDNYLAGGTLVETYGTTEFVWNWYGHLNLGRAKAGQLGNVEVRVANVNTMVVVAQLEGFISDHPILARWWIGA